MRRLRIQVRLLARRRRRLARRTTAALVRPGIASRRAIRAGIILGLIAGVSLTAGVLAATFYGQFGYHPGRNADAWASRAPEFVSATSCASCHSTQAAAWRAAPHAGVTCESCHGPLAGHPATTPAPAAASGTATPGGSPGSPGAATKPPVPLLSLDEGSTVNLASAGNSALCLGCHRAVVGRPSGFPVIDPTTHYSGPECTACHDPHTSVAPQPPAVLHTLAGLPECTVCHSPTGMRPLPPAHPTWSGSCLACHRATQP